jgi:hypothetical protein
MGINEVQPGNKRGAVGERKMGSQWEARGILTTWSVPEEQKATSTGEQKLQVMRVMGLQQGRHSTGGQQKLLVAGSYRVTADQRRHSTGGSRAY